MKKLDNDIIIAAGGLGTRIDGWSSIIPKEFLPYHDRPTILHLLSEAALLSDGNIYYVYHPYYESFIQWVQKCIVDGHIGNYAAHLRSVGKDVSHNFEQLKHKIRFIPEHGTYSDISSLLSCRDALSSDSFYLLFGDNLYPKYQYVRDIKNTSSGGVSILGSVYDEAVASKKGILITELHKGERRLVDLVEKPGSTLAKELAKKHGADSLFFLEGRFKLNHDFINSINIHQCLHNGEPKLAYALRNYAKTQSVKVHVCQEPVIDIGSSDRLRERIVPQAPTPDCVSS